MWRPPINKTLLQEAEGKSPIVVFDCETTGLDAAKDRVIQFAAIVLYWGDDGELVEDEAINLYINPCRPLPSKIVELTGITDAQLVNAPTESEVFEQIATVLYKAKYWAGQNLRFDIGFLDALYARMGFSLERRPVLDTLEMARDLIDIPKYKLGEVCKHFGVDEGIEWHNALGDIRACARLLRIFGDQYRVTDMPDAGTLVPAVYGTVFWEGQKGMKRIYLNTSLGGYYWDVRRKGWGEKTGAKPIAEVNVPAMRDAALAIATDDKVVSALSQALV